MAATSFFKSSLSGLHRLKSGGEIGSRGCRAAFGMGLTVGQFFANVLKLFLEAVALGGELLKVFGDRRLGGGRDFKLFNSAAVSSNFL